MIIFYFGADDTFERLQQNGFKRRNTIILKTLSENKHVTKVISFNYTDRKGFATNFFKNFISGGRKVKDVYFTELFTFGTYKIHFLNRFFNRVYFSLLRLQYAGSRVLAWVYWPNGFIEYKRAGIRPAFVFDADHSLLDDPNLDASGKNKLEELLNEISRKALLVVSGSKLMLNWFQQHGSKAVYRLRNGIDLSRFSNIPNVKSGKFTVVYCGILSNWIDYDLFINLVKANPAIDFTIIGRSFMNNTYTQLEKYSNVHLLGEKTAGEVAGLLPSFHVGLGLYKKGAIDGDSMKIYEYLAAGLPVICTNYHDSLDEDFNGLLLIGNSVEDFNRYISDVKEKVFVPDKNAIEQFLQDSGWAKRIDAVLDNIK